MKNKLIHISILIIMFIIGIATMKMATNSRYYSTAEVNGYPTLAGTYFNLTPTTNSCTVYTGNQTTLSYQLTNTVQGNINQMNLQYYLKLVDSNDNESNLPITMNVTGYSYTQGKGIGPISLPYDGTTSETKNLSIILNCDVYATIATYNYKIKVIAECITDSSITTEKNVNVNITVVETIYNINYELNSGTQATGQPTTFRRNDTITLLNPTRYGYNFAGWFEEADFSGQQVTQITNRTSDITLYAKWNIKYFTITYVLNSGTQASGQPTQYQEGTSVNLLNPTRAHYDFSGWYKNSSFTGSAITNTSGQSTNLKLYAKWTSRLLADYVSVGDKVNYPVNYSNITVTYTAGTSYTGWRVLSIEGTGDNKYVRLVPAGVPMSYVLPNRTANLNASTAVTNLTTGFFSTAINSTSTNNTFRKCGFKQANGNAVTTIAQLKTVFTNDYTQISSSKPVVKAMTKADVDQVWGSTTTNATYLTSNNLLAIPSTTSNYYMPYFVATVASDYDNRYLWNVYQSGAIIYTDKEHGIRPVVSLKATVETTGKTSNVWQINM